MVKIRLQGTTNEIKRMRRVIERNRSLTDEVEEKEEEPEVEVIEEPEVEEPKPQSNLFTYILIGVISVGARKSLRK